MRTRKTSTRGSAHRRSIGCGELLEPRLALCAFHQTFIPPGMVTAASVDTATGARDFTSLNVNFQGPTADVPPGFRADGGAAYGRRANGYTYGWSTDLTAAAYDRNSSRSPDEAFDTGIKTDGATWELAVLDGKYRVTVVAGDAYIEGGKLGYTIEGAQAFLVAPKRSKPWVSGTMDVNVIDGKLTIANAGGALHNKLAFIKIQAIGAADGAAANADGTWSNATLPYTGVPATVPGKVEAENFDADNGVRLTSYDTTAGNISKLYRNDSDVDLYYANDSGGFTVGSTRPGEWLLYTVNIQSTGLYNVDFRVRSGSGGGTMHLEFNGVDRTGAITLPNTGGWTTWSTVRKSNAWLTAGTYTMKLKFDSSKIANTDIGDVNWMNFTLVSGTSTAPLKWESKATMPLARYEAASASVGGKLYVFGGYYNTSIQATPRVDVYDPATNKWTQLRNMPQTLTHAAQVVDGPYVYLVGGFVGNHPGAGTTSFWKYDTRSDTWSRGPSLPAPRGAGGLALINRKLYYVGGLVRAENVTVNQSEMWNLDLANANATWQVRAPLPLGRNHFSTVSIGTKLYVMGGQNLWNEFNGNTSRVDVYDYATNKWSVGASLPKPRGHTLATATVYNNKIYLLGGNTNGPLSGVQTPLSDVTVFDPATNRWTDLTPLPGQRMGGVAGVIGNRLYFSGGNTPGLWPQNATWSALLG
ncbi:MAG: kelch repeat-containing protein [Tepidisphaeraceae bacterium]